jgi:diguanylate cyclase (GGDEF)-like protein
MRNSAEDGRPLDAVPLARVSEASLAQTARILLPCLATTLPIVAVMTFAVRNQVSLARLELWWVAGLAAEIAAIMAWRRFRRERGSGGTGLKSLATIRWAVAVAGAAWGVSLFVPNSTDDELMLLFALFAYGAGTFGMLLTAARTDLYALFDVPLFSLASLALFLTHDPMLASIGVLALCYLGLATLVHREVHRSVIEAIASTWETQRLAEGLASEHHLLVKANTSAAELNAQLAHQATHDPLTGLFNRRGAIDALERALADATPESPVGLLYLDLDRFKHINDSLGHRGGDQFIAVIADRLARSIDPGATAGRIGGDEFIAVLPNCDLGASMAVATRITSVLGQPVHAEGREVPSSVSIGVAVGPTHGSGSSELLRHANAALHRAKSSGRNRVEVFDRSVKTELHERLDSEQSLRRALDDGDIVAFFQPEIDATTGQIVGAELLARWLRRDGTVTAANEFIAVAAQAGLLERLTDHVMQQARPLIRRLSTLGLPEGFRFRVNLPPRATERSWRDNPLDSLIQGIEPSLITVDVTEAAVIDDLAAAAANLASLRVRGVRVCLDDFARGVSSLSLLRRLPLDEVRIDRTSIDTITAHPHDRAIVRSIISLVREIGLTATADGVETGAQADVLIALGCIRHQGHLYSRALPASEFDSYLTRSMVERFAQESMTPKPTIGDYPLWQAGDLE